MSQCSVSAAASHHIVEIPEAVLMSHLPECSHSGHVVALMQTCIYCKLHAPQKSGGACAFNSNDMATLACAICCNQK